MLRFVPIIFLAASAGVAQAQPCSDATYRAIASKVATGDGQGHGPDVGSDEWKSVVEFRLGIRGQPGVPSRDSEAWCPYIEKIASQRQGAAKGGVSTTKAAAPGPSFSCAKVRPSSIEALICADEALSALDRKLSGVYAAAAKKAVNEHPPSLKPTQRGWIKGRDDCWKSNDKTACVRDEYVHRIAELQAQYRLVPSRGPIFYACDGNPSNEVVVTYMETDPPTLSAERGDQTSLMFLQPGAGGVRYQGRNESFTEQQGEALVTWGYGAKELRCKKRG